MPQWAGSCWYYLRYLDPTNENAFVDPAVERYWMGPPTGPAASTCTSAASSTRCCTCSVQPVLAQGPVRPRSVSTPEPFQRLFNQGMVQAPALHRRAWHVRRGVGGRRDATVPAFLRRPAGHARVREDGQEPEERGHARRHLRAYGADTLRLYEMAMGPLDQDRPWNTADIIGVHRFLQRLWRNLVDEETGSLRGRDARPDRRDARLCTARSRACATTWKRCGSTPPSPS